MPKQRITKEMVVNAAFEIARDGGMEQVMVKNIADKIGCSVQPIYSYCKNMDGLRMEVAGKVKDKTNEAVDNANRGAYQQRRSVPQYRQELYSVGEGGTESVQDIYPA